jgi:hypothetical protein
VVQLGVFLIPPPDHPFYQITTSILGYDVWAQQRKDSTLADHLPTPILKRWMGQATIYGIHCTITGGAVFYDDADATEIEDRVSWLASRTRPFTLVNGRIFDDFHDRPVALVTTFDSPDGAISRLHQQAATLISPLHVSSQCRPPRDGDDDRARVLYTRTGETHALERFSPHWSLFTGLTSDDAWTMARNLVVDRTGLFADERTRTLDVTAIQLVAFRPDGYCKVAASFPLTGV